MSKKIKIADSLLITLLATKALFNKTRHGPKQANCISPQK
jgi:hypothetical protein